MNAINYNTLIDDASFLTLVDIRYKIAHKFVCITAVVKCNKFVHSLFRAEQVRVPRARMRWRSFATKCWYPSPKYKLELAARKTLSRVSSGTSFISNRKFKSARKNSISFPIGKLFNSIATLFEWYSILFAGTLSMWVALLHYITGFAISLE